MSGTDEDLVRRARAGDREAFGALVDEHRRVVLAIAVQKGLQPAEAEDVAQEVFIKAFHGLDTLQRSAHFSRWLYGITSHVAIDYLRSRRRRHEESGVSDLEAPLFLGPDAGSGEDRDHMDRVFKALRELPDDHRIVVTLRYLEGLTPKEIAARLGEPRGTVRSRLHHALTYLQLALSGSKPSAHRKAVQARETAADASARLAKPTDGPADNSGGAKR